MTNENLTLRLSKELSARVQQEADEIGLAPTEIVTVALQQYFGLPQDQGITLLKQLAAFVASTFRKGDFPEDVILRASRHIRDTPDLKTLYDTAIQDEKGNPDPSRRKGLNQRIGRVVKRTLGATSYARVTEVDTNLEIIGSFTLLRP